MTRMGLDEWEEKHGTGSLVTSIPAGDFLSAAKVDELEGEKLRRKYKRKAAKAEPFSLDISDAPGLHAMSHANDVEGDNISENAKQLADKYIPRAGKAGASDNGNGGKAKVAFTRVQWATRITKFWRETHDAAVNGIFLVGENLIQAKAALNESEWDAMLEHDLPFGLRTVQRLIAVAKDQRLRLTANLLPAAWGTLYELTKLGDSELDQLAKDGVLRPEMERNEVDRVRKGLRLETSGGASAAPAASGSAKRTPKMSHDATISPVRPDYSATQTVDVAATSPTVDARAVLGQIVALIDISADAPAVETLAAVRKLAADALK